MMWPQQFYNHGLLKEFDKHMQIFRLYKKIATLCVLTYCIVDIKCKERKMFKFETENS